MKVIEGLKWVLKFESFLRWVGLSLRDQHTPTLCWNLFQHVIGYGSYGFSNCFFFLADIPLAFDFILFFAWMLCFYDCEKKLAKGASFFILYWVPRLFFLLFFLV